MVEGHVRRRGGDHDPARRPGGPHRHGQRGRSVARIEEVRRQIIEGAMPAEIAAGPEGLFIPGETMDRIWLKIS